MSSPFRPITSSPYKPGNTRIGPISSLNAYSQTIAIKARCTQKSEMRNFKNGNGKLFSCVLVDEDGDIKATAFNDDAERLYPLLEEGKIYNISKFRVKAADQRYNKTSHSYEMTFGRDTDAQIAEDADKSAIPTATFNFIENLAVLQQKQDKDYVDILAALLECPDTTTLTQKTTGDELTKRDLVLCDESGFKVRLTMWNDAAILFTPDPSGTTILSVKNVRVSEYYGRSLSTSGNSVVAINDFTNPKAAKLKEWFNNGGKDEDFMQFDKENNPQGDDGRQIKKKKKEEFMWLSSALRMPIENDKGYWFTCASVIKDVFAKSLYYAGCPTCKKKVNENGDTWRCEKCDVQLNEPLYRYVTSISLADATGDCRVQVFDEEATTIFGLTANKMHEIVKELDDTDKERYIKQLTNQKQYMFKCVVKVEEYNGETKKKAVVREVSAVDYMAHGNKLTGFLESYQ